MNIFGFRVSELVRNSIEINCNAFANKLPIHANLRQQVATKEQQLEMGIDKQKKKNPTAKRQNRASQIRFCPIVAHLKHEACPWSSHLMAAVDPSSDG